jgi:hypothetical protein
MECLKCGQSRHSERQVSHVESSEKTKIYESKRGTVKENEAEIGRVMEGVVNIIKVN